MDDENFYLKSLYGRAKNYAIRQGYPDLADDFAQECAMEYVNKGTLKLTWVFIDLLRKEYGDTRKIGGRARFIQTNPKYSRAISLDGPVDADREELNHSIVASPEGNSGVERLIGGSRELPGPRQIASCLSFDEQQIYEMVFIDERSEVEVGENFGVSGSRISQIVSEIKKKIANQVVRNEILDLYIDDCERSKLEIDWIKL